MVKRLNVRPFKDVGSNAWSRCKIREVDLLNEQNYRLFNACKWHQRNDRNGDFLEMWYEYMRGEIGLDTVLDVCTRVFTEIRDEHTSPHEHDEKARMNDWIKYINIGGGSSES